MPTIKWSHGTKEEQVEREKLIEKVLPKEPIIDSYLEPNLMKSMERVLIKALKREIKIYKAFPKTNAKYDPEKFNPRNNTQCFMGQGFAYNGHGMEGWYDADLRLYRAKVGMIAHKAWGTCTLLEIWGGDHFKDWNKMVVDTFKYCYGEIPRLPKLQFHINPFYRNAKSGAMEVTAEQAEEMAGAQHLNKIAAYIEIRDRLKKTGHSNPLNLEPDAKDDVPVKSSRGRYRPDDDDEEDDDD